MPVSCVIGGQFGSEGKGKVAHALARWRSATMAVRVGGTNSGHTAYDDVGRPHVFRQLPTAALHPGIHSVVPAGAYIDPEILMAEVGRYGVSVEQLSIDPNAVVITNAERDLEANASLGRSIGSTQSGTGAAVIARIQRDGNVHFAKDEPQLQPYIRKTRTLLRRHLDAGERVIVEGTQGYGLSLLQSDEYPFVTSRDTSAATFVAEAGLSPMDVDEIVLVIRAFPIRVAGNSGPLPNEITWPTISNESGSDTSISEFTTVTKRLRRVARFDPKVVLDAIEAHPSALIALNHLDYIDSNCRAGKITKAGSAFVSQVEEQIGKKITWYGLSPSILVPGESNDRIHRLHAG